MSEIILPWPDKALSPNARTHWSVYHKRAATLKREAWAATLAAKWTVPAGDLRLSVIAHPPDRRRRDRDNLVASLKSAFDGIALALGVDDSTFRIDPPEWGEPTKGGKVVIRHERREHGRD